MPTQKNLGENDGQDSSGIIEDVSYETTELEADTPDEKSDAQRIADGEILVSDEPDEMFVAPDSVFAKPGVKAPDEEKKEEVLEKPEKPAGEKPAKPEEEKKPPAAAPDPVQKRINKITREKYEATRKAEAERNEPIKPKRSFAN